MALEKGWHLRVDTKELDECRDEVVCMKRTVRTADETELDDHHENEQSPNEEAVALDHLVLEDRMKQHN